MTKEQVKALYKKFLINSEGKTFDQFVDDSVDYGQYIGISWCGMFVGIEKDGYTHT